MEGQAFLREQIAAHGATDRVSYVCDSFSGLPPGDRSLDGRDKNWGNTPYLEVASEIVAGNFNKYGLLDHNVIFVKGFFNETMPVLSKYIDKLAVMRLDVSFNFPLSGCSWLSVLILFFILHRRETCMKALSMFYTSFMTS